MIVAGIDVGNATTKAVILNEGVLGYSIVPTTDESSIMAERALQQALQGAALTRDAIDAVVATGAGGPEVELATDHVTDVSCAVKGITWLLPSVRTVIDMGSEGCVVAKCDEEGNLIDYQTHQKCASGTGMFIDVIAEALEISLDEMGELSLKATKDVSITSSCAVFAESEVISRIYGGESKADILKGINDSIAARVASMLLSLGIEPDVAMVGGVARNAGMVDAIRRHAKIDILVPEVPQIVAAIGAALAAKERKGVLA